MLDVPEGERAVIMEPERERADSLRAGAGVDREGGRAADGDEPARTVV